MNRTYKIADVAEYIRGITFAPEDKVPFKSPGSIACLRTANIQKKIELNDVIAVPRSFVTNKNKLLKGGDLLVSSANSWNLVGKCVYLPDLNFSATAGGFISILRGKPNLINSKFLFYWLSSDKTQKAVRNCANKTTSISNLNTKRFLDIKIQLPKLSDQKEMVDCLNKANVIRQKREEAKKLAEELTMSLFIELLGDPISNTKKWPTIKLEEIADVKRGRFSPRPRNDPSYYGGKYPFIQTGDISNSNHRLKEWSQTLNEKGIKVSKCFYEGTIVIAIVGATIGATAILEINAYATDSVVGITVDDKKATNRFIEYLLRFYKPIFLRRAPETARANINLETLRPLKIIFPPLKLQKEFTDKLEKVELIIKKMEESRNQIDNQFKSLEQKYFG